MAFDARKNFAFSTVLTAPNPQLSGTSISLPVSNTSLFATPPFNAVAWPAATSNPTVLNAEIVRVTAINPTTGIVTIIRAQEGSTAQAIAAGWQIMAGPTDKSLLDIETAVLAAQSTATNALNGASTAQTAINSLALSLNNVNNTSDATKQIAFLNAAYPVGSVYINANVNTNPATLLGIGTWASFGSGQVLIGNGGGNDPNFGTLGQSGGSLTHFHWQTVGSDGGAIYAESAGAGSGQTRVITNTNNGKVGSTQTNNNMREDGTYPASSLQPYITVSMWVRTA